MDFVNGNFFKNLIPIVILIGIVALFITVLPIIIVVVLVFWGVNAFIKKSKLWKNNKRDIKFEKCEESFSSLKEEKIIDVEYKEVK
ncbi:hypothetical protein [Clostridium rectalis]|uniref:hypothetical protein n=1 Tax=Clostridium rectalis TaxID=2040295 RepID=UPI000F62C9EC|nr:hypothetical protein [Clostridium rectalis]